MSQTATLYTVPKEVFKELEASAGEQPFDSSTAKNYAIFQGLHVGLEYILG